MCYYKCRYLMVGLKLIIRILLRFCFKKEIDFIMIIIVFVLIVLVNFVSIDRGR